MVVFPTLQCVTCAVGFLWHLLTITEIKSEVNPSRRSNKTNLIKIHPEYCRLFPRTCLLFIFTIFASIPPMDSFMAVPFWAWPCETSLPVKRSFFVLTVTNVAHRGSSDVGFYSFFLSRCQNFIFHVWSTSSAFDVTLISQKPHEQAICVGLPESTTFPTASLFFCWKPPDLWRLWEHYLMTKNSVHACSSSDVMSLCTFIAVMYFILQVTNLICSVDLSSRDHHSPSFPLNKTNRITINIRISYLWYKIKKSLAAVNIRRPVLMTWIMLKIHVLY